MFKIIEYPSLQDFYKENKELIYKNRLAHYHLISFFQLLNEGETSVYQSYNVVDENGGNAIAVWGDSVYYLYALNWSEDIVSGLLSKIEVSKYTKRFMFCGTQDLILEFFKKSNLEYSINRERILYECKQVLPLAKNCQGEAYFSQISDLETIAEMTYRYGLEEWGEREGRDLNHARAVAVQSITDEACCHWEEGNKIRTIATILDAETELPIIGTLFTNKEDRNKGFGKCLVHEITRQLVEEDGRCAIVSTADDPVTNKMFVEIGYQLVSRYISISTTRESLPTE